MQATASENLQRTFLNQFILQDVELKSGSSSRKNPQMISVVPAIRMDPFHP
jgi:hypothetical protein